ncbi:hypothetical protein R1flu_025740 [Riccia fluitans]|uniref:Uncharacterized protein n=1 Tax=Riccia fluitans TaxID=41844 RepID=A0ABD1XYL8_9MARC
MNSLPSCSEKQLVWPEGGNLLVSFPVKAQPLTFYSGRLEFTLKGKSIDVSVELIWEYLRARTNMKLAFDAVKVPGEDGWDLGPGNELREELFKTTNIYATALDSIHRFLGKAAGADRRNILVMGGNSSLGTWDELHKATVATVRNLALHILKECYGHTPLTLYSGRLGFTLKGKSIDVRDELFREYLEARTNLKLAFDAVKMPVQGGWYLGPGETLRVEFYRATSRYASALDSIHRFLGEAVGPDRGNVQVFGENMYLGTWGERHVETVAVWEKISSDTRREIIRSGRIKLMTGLARVEAIARRPSGI